MIKKSTKINVSFQTLQCIIQDCSVRFITRVVLDAVFSRAVTSEVYDVNVQRGDYFIIEICPAVAGHFSIISKWKR